MSSGALSAGQRVAQRALAGGRRIIAGQPMPETHPELLALGEVQPGISAAEFASRRQRLAAQLPGAGLAVLQAAPTQFVSGAIPYGYRQDANFQYLTGIVQPGVLAVLRPDAHLTLFVSDADPYRQVWDGERLSVDAALEFIGADEAYPMGQLPSRLGPMLSAASLVAVDPVGGGQARPTHLESLPAYRDLETQGRLRALRPLVHQLRWVKSAAELQLMRRSAAAAAGAMSECMARTRPGVSEHALSALFEYRCRAAGAQRMAYPLVVAGGADACTIHYGRNDKRVPGSLLLKLDGGCELHGYCSDVTRTWPVSGKFNGAQLAVYEAVRSVHQRVVGAVRPGATMAQLHRTSIQLLAEALCTLGILPGANPAAVISDQTYRAFYPHSIGHWLGMDTHDSSSISHERALEPGVALTVEPGLYIPDSPAFGPFRGIGVRLEDDVVVTAGGAEVMSRGVPLEPTEVEQLVGSGPPLEAPMY